jgi:hypothetical protein
MPALGATRPLAIASVRAFMSSRGDSKVIVAVKPLNQRIHSGVLLISVQKVTVRIPSNGAGARL